MIIAQQKRHENIAEYLLYMWQVEDIIRACRLDIDEVDRRVISQYRIDEEMRRQTRDWYEGLIMMMKAEQVQEKGHLQICKNVLIRLNDLHVQLLKSTKYPEYGAEFYRTLPYIVEIRAKSPSREHQPGELEACFIALYGLLMLRLQNKEVTTATDNALQQISKFIALLASYFRKLEAGELDESINN